MIDPKFGFSLSILGDVLAHADGPLGRRHGAEVDPDPRVAQMLDHFTQYVGSCPEPRRRCSAASPTCRRRRASGIRAAARAPCPRRS